MFKSFPKLRLILEFLGTLSQWKHEWLWLSNSVGNPEQKCHEVTLLTCSIDGHWYESLPPLNHLYSNAYIEYNTERWTRATAWPTNGSGSFSTIILYNKTGLYYNLNLVWNGIADEFLFDLQHMVFTLYCIVLSHYYVHELCQNYAIRSFCATTKEKINPNRKRDW